MKSTNVPQLAITFPGRIKQVSENTVVIEVRPLVGPVFHEDAIKALTQGLSDHDADRVIEDAIDYLQGEVMRRSLRTSRVMPGLEARLEQI